MVKLPTNCLPRRDVGDAHLRDLRRRVDVRLDDHGGAPRGVGRRRSATTRAAAPGCWSRWHRRCRSRRSGWRAPPADRPAARAGDRRRGGLAGTNDGAAIGEVRGDRQRIDERRRAHGDGDRRLAERPGASGPRSWTVIDDVGVGVRRCSRGAGSSVPGTFCATGRTPGLDENAWKGPAPPVIVSVDGTPE